MKHTKLLRPFPTINKGKMSLSEVLSPVQFEVQDAKRKQYLHRGRASVRILNDALQKHMGGKREMPVPQLHVKSHCRATEAEVEQIKSQARKIKEYTEKEAKEQIENTTSSSATVLTKLNFLSQYSKLPFVIKSESVDLVMNRRIKAIPCKIEEDDITRLKKENVELNAKFTAKFTAMEERIAVLEKGMRNNAALLNSSAHSHAALFHTSSRIGTSDPGVGSHAAGNQLKIKN